MKLWNVGVVSPLSLAITVEQQLLQELVCAPPSPASTLMVKSPDNCSEKLLNTWFPEVFVITLIAHSSALG